MDLRSGVAEPATDLVVPYTLVGTTALEWDERHLWLGAAAAQVAEAPVDGFTRGVAAMAVLFRHRWSRHLLEAGHEAEVRADGLRDSVRAFLAADESSWLDAVGLTDLLDEER